MKKPQLRGEVETTLRALGFKPNQYKWAGCSIDIVIGQSFKTMRFPAGMSRRALSWELGRLTGWVEVLADNYSAQNPEKKPKQTRKPRKAAAKSSNLSAEAEAEAEALLHDGIHVGPEMTRAQRELIANGRASAIPSLLPGFTQGVRLETSSRVSI